MDDDGDWITARYVLSAILQRNPLVMDYIDEESFPVDDPPPAAAAGRSAPEAAPSAAVSAPPAVRASAGVAGTVCSVCTEEISVGDAVVRLPCAHLYHHGCIAPWLGIRGTCPMCRAELPLKDAGEEDGDLAGRAKAAPAPAGAAAGTSGIAGASTRAQRDAGYQYLAAGVLLG